MRPDIGQVGHPQLVRAGRDELPLHQIIGRLSLGPLAEGGLAGLVPWDSPQPLGLHQPFHGAPGNLHAPAVEFGVDLAGTVDTQVGLVGNLDVRHELGVTHATSRWGPGLGGVVGARGDLHVSVLQDGTDRLDPEPIAVLIDVIDQHRGGHLYLILRSSSAAAKKPRTSSRFRWPDAVHAPHVQAPPAAEHRRSWYRAEPRHRPRLDGPSCAGPRGGPQLIGDSLDRSTSGLGIPSRVQRHPRGPLLKLNAVLPRCCHDSHHPFQE